MSPFRVTAVVLWLFVAFAEAVGHGVILANRVGAHPQSELAFFLGAFTIALGIGLWIHSKAVAALYVALTSAGALGLVVYAFLEHGLLVGSLTLLGVVPPYLLTVMMIRKWSSLGRSGRSGTESRE